jgi:exonuclease SbcD
MRLIHTSDWHLGQHFYGKSRASEHQQFLAWLLAQVEHYNIDAVIVAGDIFDTSTPPSYAREMYFDFVAKIHALNCQVIILAGNHDSVAMLSESKQVLSHLSTQVIALASDDPKKQVITLTDQQGNTNAIVCAIPFIRPRDVLVSQAGQSATEKQQNLQQAISDYYQRNVAYAKKLQGMCQQPVPIIATGHLTTVGVSCSESVRDIYIGTLAAFPASAFPEVDYIALGHIHRPQSVAKSNHIRYSGSPIALSFDEANHTKQVNMVEFEAQKLVNITPLTIPCFQPMAVLKTNLTDLPADIKPLLAKYADQLADNKLTLWLDIEILSEQYLQDLQQRIETLIKEFPVEVIRVRKSKTPTQLATSKQHKVTLSELSEIDVFQQRLALENWSTTDDELKRERLITLFKQVLSDVKVGQS